MSKKLKLILTVSIILNIIFISTGLGFFAQSMMHKRGFHKHPEWFQDMRPETRELFKTQMHESRSTFKDNIQHIRSLRQDMANIIGAQAFDEDAFRSKAKEIEDIKEGLSANKIENTISLIKEMSQEERMAFSKGFIKEKMSSRR